MTGYLRRLGSAAVEKAKQAKENLDTFWQRYSTPAKGVGEYDPVNDMPTTDEEAMLWNEEHTPEAVQRREQEQRRQAGLANARRLQEQQRASGLLPGVAPASRPQDKAPTIEDIDKELKNTKVDWKSLSKNNDEQGIRGVDSGMKAVSWSPTYKVYQIQEMGALSESDVINRFNSLVPKNFIPEQLKARFKAIAKNDPESVKKQVLLLAAAIEYTEDGAPLVKNVDLVDRAEAARKLVTGGFRSESKKTDAEERARGIEYAKNYDPSKYSSQAEYEAEKEWDKLYAAGVIAPMIQWIYKQAEAIDADTYMDEETKGTKIEALVAKIMQIWDNLDLRVKLREYVKQGAK